MIEPAYPLPWRIEEDWTYELTAANGAILAKFPYPRGEWRSVAEAVVAAANLLGWRPIATFNKVIEPGGRPQLVDLFVPDHGRIANCFWMVNYWWKKGIGSEEWEFVQGPRVMNLEPTHWMPLPTNPEVKG